MRRQFACALLILIALQSGCKGESYEEKETKRKETQQAKEAQRTKLLDNFSKAYNADTTWQESLKGKGLWTMTVQDALIRSDGRPIAGFAGLLDVERRGSKYVLHLSPSKLSFSFFHDLIFTLECALPDLKAASGSEFNLDLLTGMVLNADYMFAARINNVRRAVFKLDAHATGEEDADVEVKTGTRFIASGECLGVKYIGEDKKRPTAK